MTDRDKVLQELQEFEATFLNAHLDPIEAIFQPDPLKEQLEKELEKDIIKASVRGKFPKADLHRVAQYHGLTPAIVEEIAKTLLESKLGHDLEAEEFNNAVKQVKWLEENIEDAGLREWKIQDLARKYRRSPSQLYACYEKALVNQAHLQPMTVKEFREANNRDVEWLVPGWIPRATTLLLHADGGVGKTLFAYQLMESVLKGLPWNGYQVRAGSCLLVQCDEPSIVTTERIDIRGIPDDAPLHILTNWQAEGLPRLAAYIERERPDLVIIDSLTTINKASTFSENDTEYARPLLHLRDLANDYGCTVLVIHHSNAGGAARGTRAIHNSVSEVWSLRRAEGMTERTLCVEKTRLGRPPGAYKFIFDEGDFSFTYLGEADENGDGEMAMEEKIRLWLGERPGQPFGMEEVSDALGLSKHTARKRLYELWAKGLCKRKRIVSQRTYSYWVEVSSAANLSDLSDLSDPRAVLHGSDSKNCSGHGFEGRSDLSDPCFSKISEQKSENAGSDRSDHPSTPYVEQISASDPLSDPAKNASDQIDHHEEFVTQTALLEEPEQQDSPPPPPAWYSRGVKVRKKGKRGWSGRAWDVVNGAVQVKWIGESRAALQNFSDLEPMEGADG